MDICVNRPCLYNYGSDNMNRPGFIITLTCKLHLGRNFIASGNYSKKFLDHCELNLYFGSVAFQRQKYFLSVPFMLLISLWNPCFRQKKRGCNHLATGAVHVVKKVGLITHGLYKASRTEFLKK